MDHSNVCNLFQIPETGKHQKGFTLYKVISILYYEENPAALTKITVWKRYNDFKTLYKELKILHRKYNIKNKLPALQGGNFFRRFDDDVINERRESILRFLEFAGLHYKLYTSKEFIQFFKTSLTPVELLGSNITSIRADLSLPGEESEILTYSEDDTSETDSISTLSSITETLVDFGRPKLKKLSSSASIISSKNSDTQSTISVSDLVLLDGQIYPTPPNTPSNDTFVQYILDATVHINIAVECENNKKIEEAYTAYKTAIDILIKHGKDDKNYNRKKMVRYQTEKYLIRAEKLYNMFLDPQVKILQDTNFQNEERIVQRPISDLYKYKVVRIIANGMLVINSDLQQMFYIKVIHKTTKFLDDNLILPENVPFMVRLHNYYNCENSLFLVLEFCNGKKITDYIREGTKNNPTFEDNHQILRDFNFEISDSDSDESFTDLIIDYKRTKNQNCDKENVETNSKPKKINKNHDVDNTLILGGAKSEHCYQENQRKLSSFSSIDEVECPQNFHQKNLVKWAAQLLLALEKLHTLGVICKDLNIKNLLINEKENLVLTYMCNVTEFPDILNNNQISLAPEFYDFEQITKAVDWWSYGAILYELFVGMPLNIIHPNGLTYNTFLKIPKFVNPETRSLLKQLLTSDSLERLGSGIQGTNHLKAHPFFSEIEWDKLVDKEDLL